MTPWLTPASSARVRMPLKVAPGGRRTSPRVVCNLDSFHETDRRKETQAHLWAIGSCITQPSRSQVLRFRRK